jgi:proteic killer suppression protein
VELAFVARSLRELCENETVAERELGPQAAELLKHRLADLRAATSVTDLLAGRPRTLDGVGALAMALDISAGIRIVIIANHPSNPLTETGEVEWSKVSRVKLLRIEKDHE